MCRVCESAPAVLDMIDTYQSISKDNPSAFHRSAYQLPAPSSPFILGVLAGRDQA
jgi:hypothetical protein